VLGAVVAFGAAVRPLGLIVAGPLAIVISAFASEEVRWGETLVSGTVMTAFWAVQVCTRVTAPWLLGY
jgi:hypothetical protein